MPFVKKRSLRTPALLVALALGLLAGFVWSGIYNVGADDHHTRPVMLLMQSLRDRSIQARSKDIVVPPLDDPALVLKGAGQYAAMCTGCHLAPGMADSEIRPGLYPQPPDLSRERIDPRVAFWTIKHGIKMSAMPAWGASHDDQTIWSMVAFLRKLPELSPAQYKDIVAKAPPDEDMEGGGHHHHGDAADEGGDGHAGAPAVATPTTDEAPAHDAHSHAHAAEVPAAMEGFSPRAVPAAEAVAEAFHAALKRGDRDAVLALLAPDATISEGGETQTRAQYAAGHLGEDIAFLKDAQVKPRSLASMPMGDSPMVGSTSRIDAVHDGKPVALISTEVLTLQHTAGALRIKRVEWTSTRQTD